VEQEFFVQGTAHRYSTPALTTGGVIDSGHSYRTRLVVRRPASSTRFSGTVVMEIYANGPDYEHDAFWLDSPDQFIRRGYAWIGVSALSLGIHQPATGLRDWSPIRYGTLDVTDGGTILDDALSYDIISQAAQAVKNPVGVDPMGGLHVQRLFAAGGGKSANRLALYVNSIHPLAAVFDGFILAAGGGPIRADLDTRVFEILTETSVAGNQAAVRQPDSVHFRSWEVAGSATVDFRMVQGLAPLQARDNVPRSTSTDCNAPPLSRIPFYTAVSAAIDGMVRWVTDDIEPPTAPKIQVTAMGPPVVIARDTHGNATGGLRLPQMTVPTATNTGLNSGTGMCSVEGSYQPFDDATLASMYPDKGTYIDQVVQATLDRLENGFLVPEDAAATISDAVRSQNPGHGAAWYSSIPTQVVGIQGVVAVAGGAGHSVALKRDGTVWTWGTTFGPLGDPTTVSDPTPIQVSGLGSVVAVAAGESHTLALKSDGTVFAWGWNRWGQLGDGTSTNRTAPVQVNGLTGVAAIAAGGATSMALKKDGTVWAWGVQNVGAVWDGIGWPTPWTPTPLPVSGISGIVAIAVDYDHYLALQSDGTVWTWGWLGWINGNWNSYQPTPAHVDGLTGVAAATLASGDYLAAKADGTVWEWGTPDKGIQLTPIQVNGLDGVIALAGGNAEPEYFCGNCGQRLALKNNGTVWAWGDNDDGQLGDGTIGPVRMTPAQVVGLTGVVAIGAGDLHSLAVKRDGTVWAWGNNDSGQLGVGGSRMVLFMKLPELVRQYHARHKASWKIAR
jgi:alpha-tubulin suppressor-like RCC1 family protein